MRIVAIVQARMGSQRLPNKAFCYIAGQPSLAHVIGRLGHCEQLHDIVIATGDEPANKRIAKWAFNHQVPCFTGSEEDVLDRLYRAAQHFHADAVVRICADRILIDPQIVDKVVLEYLKAPQNYDYVTNNQPPSYPDGLDVEIYPLSTLKKLDSEISDPFYRDWFPCYLWEYPGLFRTLNVQHQTDLSHHRWVLDYPEDLAFIRKIFYYLWQEKEMFYMEDILKLLKQYLELSKINAGHKKNEGYYLALEKK